MTETTGTVRVAIVDDDPWVGRGRAAVLDGTDGVRAVAVLLPSEALARTTAEDWDDVDVLVVDAHEESARFDQFIGVSVVGHVRALTGRTRPRIVVITGHVFNELLRVRMAEAGADLMYAHSEVRTPSELRDVVLRDQERSVLAQPPGSSVNEAVEWAARRLGAAALAPESQKALPVSRRTIITARQKLHRQIRPAGEDNEASATVPSWRRVVEYLDRARGSYRPPPRQ